MYTSSAFSLWSNDTHMEHWCHYQHCQKDLFLFVLTPLFRGGGGGILIPVGNFLWKVSSPPHPQGKTAVLVCQFVSELSHPQHSERNPLYFLLLSVQGIWYNMNHQHCMIKNCLTLLFIISWAVFKAEKDCWHNTCSITMFRTFSQRFKWLKNVSS